jgi:transcriptional regulator with XRE-family HTH domain
MLITLDGEKIRELRESKKLSLKQMEKLTGLTDSALSAIENNSTPKPYLNTGVSIAEALGVPLKKITKKVS